MVHVCEERAGCDIGGCLHRPVEGVSHTLMGRFFDIDKYIPVIPRTSSPTQNSTISHPDGKNTYDVMPHRTKPPWAECTLRMQLRDTEDAIGFETRRECIFFKFECLLSPGLHEPYLTPSHRWFERLSQEDSDNKYIRSRLGFAAGNIFVMELTT